MKRRSFLQLLGFSAASVAFGLPKLAAAITPEQLEAPIAVGDVFSLYMGQYTFGTMTRPDGTAGATIPLSWRRVYRITHIDGDEAEADCTNWYQRIDGEEPSEPFVKHVRVSFLDEARKVPTRLTRTSETISKAD